MSHVNIALFVPHAGCRQQCSFCNQITISGKAKPLHPDEIDRAVAIALQSNHTGMELAFFGGSFTAIDPDYRLTLLERGASFVDGERITGIRISTRPDAIDDEILAQLKAYKVSAIELGAQSMDDRVLSLNRRGHTAAQVVCAAQKIRGAGFSLGLQMMTGLLGDSPTLSLETARQFIALQPDGVRIYPTVVLAGTYLAALYEKGQYQPFTLEETVPLCAKLLALFDEAGIPVLRLGLHAGAEVEAQKIAGAYHPALRELCEGELYYQKALSLFTQSKQNFLVLSVNPRAVSKLIGNGKRNINRLAELGFTCKIKADPDLPMWQVRAEV